MYVVTMDQRSTRQSGDLVPDLVRSLRPIETAVEFQRSVGDEVQGVTAEASEAVAAGMLALRSGHWSVGIGVGPLDDPLPLSIADAGGDALVYARQAAERALRLQDAFPITVAGISPDIAAEAEAVLRLLGRIVAVRSDAEWRVVDLLVPGVRGQQKLVAQELGISTQAVSKAVVRSLWQEEWAARPAAARLLGLLDEYRTVLA